jgi:hypothetical protein
MKIDSVLDFVRCDSIAASYQTMGQYRSELARMLKDAITEFRDIAFEDNRDFEDALRELDDRIGAGEFMAAGCGRTDEQKQAIAKRIKAFELIRDVVIDYQLKNDRKQCDGVECVCLERDLEGKCFT